MTRTTVRIAEKEIDLLKWGVRVLIGVIIFFAQQLYRQVQDQDRHIDRLRERVIVLETKAGIERPRREENK